MSTSNKTVSLAAVHEWAKQRGPELRRCVNTSGISGLTNHERRELEAIKAICPCHFTDHPREEFSSNNEDCDICGRKM